MMTPADWQYREMQTRSKNQQYELHPSVMNLSTLFDRAMMRTDTRVQPPISTSIFNVQDGMAIPRSQVIAKDVHRKNEFLHSQVEEAALLDVKEARGRRSIRVLSNREQGKRYKNYNLT